MDLTEECYFCKAKEHKVYPANSVTVNGGSVQMRICCKCGHFALFCGGGTHHTTASNIINPTRLEEVLDGLEQAQNKLHLNG